MNQKDKDAMTKLIVLKCDQIGEILAAVERIEKEQERMGRTLNAIKEDMYQQTVNRTRQWGV